MTRLTKNKKRLGPIWEDEICYVFEVSMSQLLYLCMYICLTSNLIFRWQLRFRPSLNLLGLQVFDLVGPFCLSGIFCLLSISVCVVMWATCQIIVLMFGGSEKCNFWKISTPPVENLIWKLTIIQCWFDFFFFPYEWIF